jgi:hypothetical protein
VIYTLLTGELINEVASFRSYRVARDHAHGRL